MKTHIRNPWKSQPPKNVKRSARKPEPFSKGWIQRQLAEAKREIKKFPKFFNLGK